MRLRLVLLAFAACVVAPALAQPAPAPGRIPTVTRLVKLFTGLEMDLVARTHAKDLSALDALLDPSFELRAGNTPGTPVPRDAWIRDARAAPRAPPRIDQMSVHDFGDVAIVSFRETAVAGATRGGSARFVVDCWKRDGDAWRLAVRYVSDASAQGVKLPSAAATIDKRY
ncbi:MAG TPA: nuclear transport factor 2 family protein [Casimicrobiaceae bacterium]|nr:nuclear transport factor 2 family protein [Casimicrobiaceae bacterium]